MADNFLFLVVGYFCLTKDRLNAKLSSCECAGLSTDADTLTHSDGPMFPEPSTAK